MLMVVTNNGWGISTPARTQHGERHIVDRGRAFGIPGAVVDGNDPVASWLALERAVAYCRRERRPYLLEARVSRLHGHSSASGARRVSDEPDCLPLFEQRLRAAGLPDPWAGADVYAAARAEIEAAVEQVRSGVAPSGEAGEVDLAVRCASEQWAAIQTCLAGFGCRWQTYDPEGRLVQYGVLRHAGHDFFVHVYLIAR